MDEPIWVMMVYGRSCCGCVDVVGLSDSGKEGKMTIPHQMVGAVIEMLRTTQRLTAEQAQRHGNGEPIVLGAERGDAH